MLHPTYRSLSRNDLSDYVKSHYLSSRMVLAGAGGVQHDDLVKLANQHLGSLNSSSGSQPPTPARCRFTGTIPTCLTCSTTQPNTLLASRI